MSQFKAIPKPDDQRNVSQNDLLTNFAYLNNASGAAASGILPVDHLSTGDNVAVPTNGFHQQVSFISKGSLLANLTNSVNGQNSDSIAYSKTGSGQPQFQFKFGAATSQDVQISDCRAAISFVGSTAAIIGNSYNATVVRNSDGDYTITFPNALPDNKYMVFIGLEQTNPRIASYNTRTTTTVNITVRSLASLFQDPNSVSVYVVGLY